MSRPVRIVVLDGRTLNPGDLSWKALEAIGETTVYDRTGDDPKLIVDRALDAEIVLTNKTPLSAAVIGRLEKLEYIGVLATGFNVVDTAAAADRSIPVTNIPAYGTDSVAQMAFAHVLHHCHRVADHSADVRAGGWSGKPDFCYWISPQIELAGQTMGIIGFGRIGRRVGEIASAFGMRVLAHSSHHVDAPEWPGFSFVGIDELLAQSDIVSLNCPLTPQTAGLMNAERLAKMKRSAFLLNLARGPLVVASDLAAALRDHTIAGAGIDVLGQEPPEPGNPLLDAPNLTVTPHIAWATHAARARLLETAIDNVQGYLSDQLLNVVN